jgi:hypothetical protein
MHWSRLVDLPIAGLIRLFSLFVSPARAELLARAIWPLLPLLPACLALAEMGERLAGRIAGMLAPILVMACVPALMLFAPGRIDHHNLQLAGSLWLVALILRPNRGARAGIAAGLVAAVVLAIGLEMIVIEAAVSLFVALDWALRGRAARSFAQAFVLSFAGSAILLFLATAAPSLRLVPSCDMISPAWLLPLVVGSAGLTGVMAWSPANMRTRLLSLIPVMAASALSLGLLNPACFAGPYGAVDPRLFAGWMKDVGEAQNIFKIAADYPAAALAMLAMPAIGLAAAVALLRRADSQSRRVVFILGATLALQTALTLWQSRGAPLADLLALPFVAAGIAAWAQRFGRHAGSVILAALLVCNNFTLALASDIAVRLVSRPVAATADDAGTHSTCLATANLARFDAVPRGIILAPIEDGPAILATTGHSVVSGPYHRDARGILDTIAAYESQPSAARGILQAHHVGYVMACTASAEFSRYAKIPGSLAAGLSAGNIPDWLAPIALPLPRSVRFFAVRP